MKNKRKLKKEVTCHLFNVFMFMFSLKCTLMHLIAFGFVWEDSEEYKNDWVMSVRHSKGFLSQDIVWFDHIFIASFSLWMFISW